MAKMYLVVLSVIFLLMECVYAVIYSSRLIHRFSDEVKARRVARRKGGEVNGLWPERKSLEYYRVVASTDLQRQKMKLGPQFQFLFPSEGSKTLWFGNDFGWLHYTWIDIGTPNVSFLVALDAGSDLLWLPCDCMQCAPLSASYYNSLDRDLHEYNPSDSGTSKYLSCSHWLCELGSSCKSPEQSCPYTVNYYSEDTSTSGLLVEDVLHLASGSTDASNKSVRLPVVIGCGSKQSGGYLDGIAPDGLMGLGLGNISVPSFLAKAGFIRNSFSLCFDEDGSGRIYFGDQGLAIQQATPFLASDGKYVTYIVGMEACCIGGSCLEQTSFKVLVDSGSSFTYIPNEIYKRVVQEFDRRVNATKASFEGYPWQYCYRSSFEGLPKTPSVTLKFASNNSFVVDNPVFVIHGTEGVDGFCLAIQPADEDIGTIGQNFMTGYRMVFDRENLKLGWSHSNCHDLGDGKNMPLTPSPNVSSPNSLPTTEQQNTTNGHAVAPAVAGRTPSKSSAASIRQMTFQLCLAELLLLYTTAYIF
ncbi:unnamed protein product [Ilex paraguariensis]|uniref:Peptidase A1 domain-containing protein n=1 Tax=Ilex paraguariensis TaxID=185542 RepID=A0ABC8UXG3_9AQUA